VKSKIVTFEKIKVRNFLSFGDEPIEITFKNGITFITGYNKDENSKNGVGKTSLIVESLSFLLFGETYRDINQKLIKNNSTKGSCIVEGWLKVNNDQLYIVRSISPNKLILSVNGDSDKYTKSIPETTKDIAERIGISKNIFTNTVVMTNKDSMAFLNQKKDAKTKFIEGILGLEAFAEFLKLAKDDSKDRDSKKLLKLQRVSDLEKQIVAEKNYAQRHSENIINSKDRLEAFIEALKDCQPVDNSQTIENLESKKKSIRKLIDEKNSKLKLATAKQIELSSNCSSLRKTITTLSNKPSHCPSCKRKYEEHDQDQIQQEIDSLQSQLKACQEKYKKFTNAIEKSEKEVREYVNSVDSIDTNIRGLNLDQQKYIKASSDIEHYQNELLKLDQSHNPFLEKIIEIEESLALNKIELEDIIRQAKISSIIKELASPTGAKAIMIKKIITSLNLRINFYLMKLNSPFRVEFDEFFEESFKALNGQEYCYGSLSGGEAKRVDFAMLFAFRDIRRLQSNVHINITVMDELFDSALDDSGMFNIMELLKDSTEECFLIVTHHPNNVDSTNCDVIELVKENRITRLKT
jgi:DNA repair exonuclease SbcCD ATPase subunit